jgi:two-component system, NarL family, response regulator NreC
MRILLADDHGIVRRGMKSLIECESGWEICGEATDGREALRLCETLQPDLAILDIAMPLLNGVEVAAQAIKQNPRLKVIMLSMYSDESYVLRALCAGARGYLLKEAAEEELRPAIAAVASGNSFFSPAISRILADDYVRQLQQRGLQDSWDLLTAREREVLQLLAEGRTNKEVAALLNVGVSTVDTHRNKIMQKLDLHNFAELVLYAVRKGLIANFPMPGSSGK